MNTRYLIFGNLGANDENFYVWFNMVVEECLMMDFKVVKTILRPKVHI